MKSPKIDPRNRKGWSLVLTKINRPELGRQLGISKQAVHKWKEVPLRFVVDVERITGIPREMISPGNIEFFRPSTAEVGHAQTQD